MMKPQLALDLSLDGIALLSRAPDGGWWREGSVRLDDPHFAQSVARLRERGIARMGEPISTYVVLPDSQLLFTTYDRDDRKPEQTIRASLEGRTPYAVEDLAFDYIERGDRLEVAVVALETLLEAESFAAENGFRPLGLCARPEPVDFHGVPWFGPTALAVDFLDGSTVERPDGPFHIVAAPPMPEPEPEAPPAPEPLAPEPEMPAAEVPPPTDAKAEEPAPEPPETAPASEPDPLPPITFSSRRRAQAPTGAQRLDLIAPRLGGVTRGPVPPRRALPDIAPPLPPRPPASPEFTDPEPPAMASAPEEAPTPEPIAKEENVGGDDVVREAETAEQSHAPEPDELEASEAISSEPAEITQPPEPVDVVEEPEPVEALPEAPAAETAVESAEPDPEQAETPDAEAEPEPEPEPEPEIDAEPETQVEPVASAAAAPEVTPDPEAQAEPDDVPTEPRIKPHLRPEGLAGLATPVARSAAKRRLSGLVAPMRGMARKAKPAPVEDTTPPDTVEPEVASRAAPRRRIGTGLMLTLGLIVAMAGVAGWSALFLDGPDELAAGAVATDPARPAGDAEVLELLPAPGSGDRSAASLAPPDPVQLETADAEAAVEPEAPAEPEVEAVAAPDPLVTSPRALPRPQEAEAPSIVASTDPAPDAPEAPPVTALPDPETANAPPLPEGPSVPSEIASAEEAPAETTAETPAPEAVTESAPEATPAEVPSSEPALVAATPEGTVAPGGYLVIAGRPDVMPQPRGGETETVDAALETDGPAPEADALDVARATTADRETVDPQAAEVPETSDPAPDAEVVEDEATPALSPEDEARRAALSRVRPQVRPREIAPVETPADKPSGEDADVEGTEVEPAPEEEAAAEAAALALLRQVRPQQRPADRVVEEPEPEVDPETEAIAEAEPTDDTAIIAAQEAAAASLAAARNAAEAVARAEAAAAAVSPLALPRSSRPGARPRGVERDAARIVTRRREAASAATASASAGNTTAAPSAPARGETTIRSAGGSVSRAATENNQIRLNRINLIGTYGSAQSRRALVRLANGRYVKVQVGDRLDRGRVIAIGNGVLRYQRSGRNLELRMPRA